MFRVEKVSVLVPYGSDETDTYCGWEERRKEIKVFRSVL